MTFTAKDQRRTDNMTSPSILVSLPWQFKVETHRVTMGGSVFLDQYLCIRHYKNVL